MRTLEKVIAGLKKHIAMGKIIEKRDENFQKILKERNFFRENTIRLTEESEGHKKSITKLQQKVRNLEIDNNNYRTYLFKNREIESRHEYKRQEHTIEVLGHMTKETLRINSMITPEGGASHKKVKKFGVTEHASGFKDRSPKVPIDNENGPHADWKMFKKKDAFAGDSGKVGYRIGRPISSIAFAFDNGFGGSSEKLFNPPSTSFRLEKSRLKSCAMKTPVDENGRPKTIKGRMISKMSSGGSGVINQKTLSYLLSED